MRHRHPHCIVLSDPRVLSPICCLIDVFVSPSDSRQTKAMIRGDRITRLLSEKQCPRTMDDDESSNKRNQANTNLNISR